MHWLKYYSIKYTFSDVIRCTQMEIFIAPYLIVVLILWSLVKLVFIFVGNYFFIQRFFFRNLSCEHVNIRKFLLPVFNIRKKRWVGGEDPKPPCPHSLENLNLCVKIHENNSQTFPPDPPPPKNTSDTLSGKKYSENVHIFTFLGYTSIWGCLLFRLYIWFNWVRW